MDSGAPSRHLTLSPTPDSSGAAHHVPHTLLSMFTCSALGLMTSASVPPLPPASQARQTIDAVLTPPGTMNGAFPRRAHCVYV